MRRRQFLSAVLGTAVLSARQAAAAGITVRDAMNRDVTIPRPPRRIVTIFSSNTELVGAVGLLDRVVGIDGMTTYPPEVARIRKVGGRLGMSLDAVDLRVDHDGRALLDNVSIAFQPGALVGLVGPNGAGKTTLLRHLAGLRTPQSGRVMLGGRNVLSMAPAERGRIVGYMPQHFEPAWDFTVREIVELGASRASDTLVRFDRVIDEHELRPLLQRRWSRLSGGERARTLLAAVLIAEPAVLLADEPGAGLDIRHRLELLNRLRASAPDRVLVVVMHALEAAVRHCDRLVVFAAGRVAIDGTPEEVVGHPDLDAVFGVTFQRVTIDRAKGPLLPELIASTSHSRRGTSA